MKKSVFFLLAIVILASCQSKPLTGQTILAEGGSYQNLTPDELRVMLNDKNFVLINVHIPFAGNIAGTDLSIPYDQITDPEYLAQLPTDQSARIVLYCRSGRMSEIAAEELASLGYTGVWNLDGGMAAWEQASYGIEK